MGQWPSCVRGSVVKQVETADSLTGAVLSAGTWACPGQMGTQPRRRRRKGEETTGWRVERWMEPEGTPEGCGS